MREIIYSSKAGALVETSIKSRNLFFCFFFLFLIHAELIYSASHKVNDRTKIYVEEISADSVALKIDNDFVIPVTVKLALDLKNLEAESNLDFSSTVPAKSIGYILAKFKKKDSLSPYTCSYKWKIVLGDTSKIPDVNYLYGYPFQKGSNYKVSQGPGGIFSHKDMYAYDFLMPLGTPVTAARDGIIASLKYDSSVGGADRKYIEDANFVSVYHSDGTIANYLHLNTNGVLVKEGQTVKKGEIIGYSGNTGFSSGPHLHFEVTQPALDFEKNKWMIFNWDEQANSLFAGL